MAVHKGAVEAPSQRTATVGPPVDAWFERAFQVDPDLRFPSAELMCDAFTEAPPDQATGDVTESSQTLVSEARRSDRGETPNDSAEREAETGDRSDGQVEPPLDQEQQSKGRSRLWGLPLSLAMLSALGIIYFVPKYCSVESQPSQQSSTKSATAPTSTPSSGTSATQQSRLDAGPKAKSSYAHIIQAVVRRHVGAIDQCFGKNDAPTAAVQRTVDFAIQTDGRTSRVALAERQTMTPQFDECLLAVFRWLRFPPHGKPGQITISYPLTLSPNRETPLSDEGCRESKRCRIEGACSAGGKACQPASDMDCRQAQVCLQRGQCTVVQNRCVSSYTDCSRSGRPCTLFGLCTERQGRCVAESVDTCARARACTTYGQCTAFGGVCVAESSEACQRSSECAERGLCSQRGPWCVANLDEHCQRSNQCKKNGLCVASAGQCVAENDQQCQASEVCKTRGWCAANTIGTCHAVKDEHCRKAEICQTDGKCLADRGLCVQQR